MGSQKVNPNQIRYDKEISERNDIAVKENNNIFVEAGAGAGKSTSLVDSAYYTLAKTYEIERIHDLLKNGMSENDIKNEIDSNINELSKLSPTPDREILFMQEISNHLHDIVIGKIQHDVRAKDIYAITFTNKATEELRVKIVTKLQNKKDCLQYEIDRKNKLLNSIDDIHVSTIHKFAEDILKENAVKAGLSPDFIPVEDEDYEGIINETIRKYFRSFKHWKALSKYEKELGISKKELKDRIVKAFLELTKVTAIQLDKSQIYHCQTAINYNFNKRKKCVEELLAAVDEFLKKNTSVQLALNKCYEDAGYVIDQNEEDRQKTIQNVLSFSKKDQKSFPFKLSGKGFTKDLKNNIQSTFQPYLDKIAEDVLNEETILASECLDYAYELYILFLDNRDKDVEHVSNSDLIYKTYKLLKNDKSVLNKTRARVKRLFIDEYQDTDSLQYEIASMIADGKNDCLYLVGDPKQSIYRFRGAEPEVFFSTKDEFLDKKVVNITHKTHELNINFRSNSEIIKWVNKTYNSISLVDPSTNYSYNDMLYAHDQRVNNEIDPSDYANNKNLIGFYKFNGYEPEDIKDLILYLKENKLIRKAIKKEVNGKLVTTTEYVPIAFEDIMVLMEAHNRMPQYVEEFTKNNIPARVYGESRFSNTLALRAFVYLYESLFRNDMAGLALAESTFHTIAPSFYLNKKHSECIKTTKGLLNQLKSNVTSMDAYGKAIYLAEHISLLLKENHVYQDFEVNFAASKIYQMIEKVFSKGFSNGNELINEFNHYYTSLIERESLIQDEIDAVLVINLHKAKGLEAPIVIWVSTDTRDSYGSNISAVFKNGVAYTSDLINCVKNNPVCSHEVDHLKSDELYEDARKEYVATTRPKEAFIFACTDKNKGLFLNENRNYHLLDDDTIRLLPTNNIIDDELIQATEEESAIAEEESKKIKNEELIEDYSDDNSKPIYDEGKHEYNATQTTVATVSPSSLEASSSQTREKLRNETGELPHSNRPKSNDVGTILHRALELLIKEELEPEEAVKYAIKENLDLIPSNDNGEFEQFFLTCVSSFKGWFKADGYELFPEFGFSYLDNSQINNGSIDLLMVKDDECVIIDYKSDEAEYIKEDSMFETTLKEKYENQINAYGEVVARLFPNKKISKKIVYFRRYNHKTHTIDVKILDL